MIIRRVRPFIQVKNKKINNITDHGNSIIQEFFFFDRTYIGYINRRGNIKLRYEIVAARCENWKL